MATESIAVQMEKILNEYSQEVKDATESAMDITAKEAVAKLKATSPRAKRGKHPGRYAKGWRVKKDGKMTCVVHNATDYQLTHLLENGHEIKNQFGTYGRTRAIKHIKPVEEWCKSEFPIRISQGLK